jgi:hypothetical protein
MAYRQKIKQKKNELRYKLFNNGRYDKIIFSTPSEAERLHKCFPNLTTQLAKKQKMMR